MAVHEHMVALREHGLQDGCERCAEQAQRPFETLDHENILALIARVKERLEPRSEHEATAMRKVRDALDDARFLKEIGALD